MSRKKYMLEIAEPYIVKTELTKNRTHQTFRWKAVAMSLIKMAKQYEMEFRPKLAPQSKYDKNDIYALAEYAQFNTCLTCTNKDGPCELRRLLAKLEIEPTGGAECPYDVWGDMEAIG